MIFLILSLVILIISAVVIGIIFWIKVSGNESISTPKMSFSWPSWLKGSAASYTGLGLFSSLVVLFLADFEFFHPIIMIILLAVVFLLIVQDMKKLGWLKLIVLLILIGSIANYALSLRGDEVPSISEKVVEVAPATQPFLGEDQGTEEQPTTRGEVVETVSLPPATQLPATWIFSSGGRLEVQGKYRLQLHGGRYAEFDVKNGDYVESDGYVGNELPSSNVSQYLAPDLSVGLLIILSQDGRWYKADQFDVIPGVQYELALNSNQAYLQFITYLQAPEITVLSQE